MNYCTKIKTDDLRVRIIDIAEAMGLEVHSLTTYNPINTEHIDKYGGDYYLYINNKLENSFLAHMYIPLMKNEVSNEEFVKIMFLITENKRVEPLVAESSTFLEHMYENQQDCPSDIRKATDDNFEELI